MISIGIDLGTTNTAIAAEMRVLRFSEGITASPILASVVAYPPSGATLVGAAARRRRAIDPKNTIYSAKRLIASKWLSRRTHEFRTQYPFDLVETIDGYAAFKTRVGVITPAQVGTTVIRALCQRLALSVDELTATVAVPAAFDAQQREATRDAVCRAGIATVQVIEEPTATALAYLKVSTREFKRIAVYDLGGGTFDLAIVDCSKEPFQIIGHGGDAYLGGDDIDRALANWTADQLLKRSGWDLRADSEVFDRLVLECERSKIRLSAAPQTTIDITQVDPAAPQDVVAVEITEPQFSDLATDLVRRTFVICDEVLRNAALKASDIDAVFLAGGVTHLAMIRRGIAKYFGREPLADFDPLEVVSVGASVGASGELALNNF